MKHLFSLETQDPVSRLSHYRQVAVVAVVAVAAATLVSFPEVAMATVKDGATKADGLEYIPKLIQDQMKAGGSALIALGGAVLAVGSMAFTGITMPKAGAAAAVGGAAGYGVDTVLGISGAAII